MKGKFSIRVASIAKLGCVLIMAAILSTRTAKQCLSSVKSSKRKNLWYDRYRCNGTGVVSKYSKAVVSMLTSEDYLRGMLALGESIKENTSGDYVLITLILEEKQISQSTLDSLSRLGWEICAVPRIPPPKEESVYPRFRDQFTKFSLWAWVEFERVVYLDADCLVVGDISSLFTMKEPFGAARDYASGQFRDGFNMGVFTVRPDIWEFSRLMDIKNWFFDYQLDMAEQGLLQALYKPWDEIDMQYNANLAIYLQDKALWESRRNSIKVIHYTMEKPFLALNEDTYIELSDLDIRRPIEYWIAYAKSHGI
jgi:alpha-N-acetylglucosamine transferase